MCRSSISGYPRIGERRELKRALEGYWDGEVGRDDLLETARALRLEAWRRMRDSGIDLIPSNTFSFYDHVLDTTAMVGAVPPRYHGASDGVSPVDLDVYFAMARGRQDGSYDVPAMEMTKWFDTNYHYIVPEFTRDQRFSLVSRKPVDEYEEARAAGIETMPVLLGPVTYLLLGKVLGRDGKVDRGFERLSLLEGLLPVYAQVLRALNTAGARWVQFDEPVLVQDRTPSELAAVRLAYERLAAAAGGTRLVVQTLFGELDEAFDAVANLPVAGIGMDFVHGPRTLARVRRSGLGDKHLFAGIVDGRNVWINDLAASLETLRELRRLVGDDRLVVSTSCSLLHVPIELRLEQRLDPELVSWLAFGNQKIDEVALLVRALHAPADRAVRDALATNAAALASRRTSLRTHDRAVRDRAASTTAADYRRAGDAETRRLAQQARLGLPAFPCTTIGSFPQTPELRHTRAAFTRGDFGRADYDRAIAREIEQVIRLQESLDLDVLVHGEPERSDMVEYFGQQLEGYAFTRFGWVQSYGSRCVRPPIVFGDVSRPAPMSVRWSRYAQSLTDRPVKGMVTGPVTMLNWSFVRDDQPRAETCRQIALAIRDEVVDLEAAGIRVIQIDEPALREGLPLRRRDWAEYLAWAIPSFRLAACGVRNDTQIHTHMCYAAFDDIIEAISDMDADLISIESSRSGADSLEAFREFEYDKQIGPGVYDVHSPRVPSRDEIAERLRRAAAIVPAHLLWVNPDCGLKTRRYEEAVSALRHMVEAAKALRQTHGSGS